MTYKLKVFIQSESVFHEVKLLVSSVLVTPPTVYESLAELLIASISTNRNESSKN